MTGSAFSDGRCVGVASRREFIRMGRRFGGGGGKKFDLTGGGGFIFSVFWVFFSSVFSEVFRGVFFLISGAFGCRFGGQF